VKIFLIVFVILVLGKPAYAQGFVNLDFESAQVLGYARGNNVTLTNAIPGWVGYSINPGGGTQFITQVFYEATSPFVGYPATIALQTTSPATVSPGLLPIQGLYSVLLESAFPGNYSFAAVGQTGEIPSYAKTLIFWGTFSGQITFAGQAISYSTIGTVPNNNIYRADISSFAGHAGELLFATTQNSFIGTLDNIQFSTEPVPEPSEIILVQLGALLFYSGRSPKNYCSLRG
jgi:hypothetical protein